MTGHAESAFAPADWSCNKSTAHGFPCVRPGVVLRERDISAGCASATAGWYPSPSEHTRSYLFGGWEGKREELAAKGMVFDSFYIEEPYKQILLEVFGKRRLAEVAFAARWI